ncbi:MAG: hypothetical protein J7647_01760 [Cyanobacteria bacterium SBLK]|nr:hypothetical protein [Cyanobacteria bacterium SBLK]
MSNKISLEVSKRLEAENKNRTILPSGKGLPSRVGKMYIILQTVLVIEV